MKEARTASVGQMLDLAATVQQGIPRELRADLVQKHLEHKGDVHRWLELGLARDLTEVNFSQIEALLEGWRFSAKIRQKLEAAGWVVVEIPEGVTLTSLAESGREFFNDWFLTDEMVSVIPTQRREVAWYPIDPLIPGSTSLCFGEQMIYVRSYFQGEIQKEFGLGIEAVFPTAEEVAYLLFEYKGDFLPTFISRTISYCWAANLAINTSRGVPAVMGAHSTQGYEDIGVLRFVVPRT